MLVLFSVYLYMITDPMRFCSFKRASHAAEMLSLDQKFRILEALLAEAREFGSFGNECPLHGLEDDTRLAAALNANVSNPPR